MKVELRGYHVYQWAQNGNIWSIGNYIHYNNTNIVNILSKARSTDDIATIMRNIKGNFGFIIHGANDVWYICTDNAKSFSIFYDTDLSIISDNSQAIVNEKGLDRDSLNLLDIGAMVASSYTIHGQTTYSKIRQCEAGQIIIIDTNTGTVNTYKYYDHYINKVFSEKALLDQQFSGLLDDVFDDLIRSLHGRSVVLPLSGGYDSRLIACYLKKNNYKKVICYTYGIESSGDEVKYSRKVASQLGYKWYFVEYTEEKWNELLDSEYFRDYCNYSSNNVALPHVQEIIALAELQKNHCIPEDAIIIPGFCADAPAGSFIRSELQDISTADDLTKYIYGIHFKQALLSEDIESKIKSDIRESIQQLNSTEPYSFEMVTKLYDSWLANNRLSQYIINALRIYDYYGYEWRMPFWDRRFLDFWYQMRVEERENCEFYIKHIFSHYFETYGVDYKKPNHVVIRSRNDSNFKRILIRMYEFFEVQYYIRLGLQTKKRHNINNYNFLSRRIYRLIDNKRILNTKYEGIMQMLSLWWCEKTYGSKVVLLVEK